MINCLQMTLDNNLLVSLLDSLSFRQLALDEEVYSMSSGMFKSGDFLAI